MSGFIGAAMPVSMLRPDRSVIDETRWCRSQCARVRQTPIPPKRSMATRWWPSRSGFIGDGGVDVSMFARIGTMERRPSGCNGRLAFVGVARDFNGSPIPAAKVRCFRTSSVELVSSVVCDANGHYVATTPYVDGHFLVVHGLSGSTPVSGASIDTVIPG